MVVVVVDEWDEDVVKDDADGTTPVNGEALPAEVVLDRLLLPTVGMIDNEAEEDVAAKADDDVEDVSFCLALTLAVIAVGAVATVAGPRTHLEPLLVFLDFFCIDEANRFPMPFTSLDAFTALAALAAFAALMALAALAALALRRRGGESATHAFKFCGK